MTLIERLAEKENEQEVTSMRREDRIRWWLNAIADELEKDMGSATGTNGAFILDWLRTQASEAQADDQ